MFFRKKEPPLDSNKIVSTLLSLILSDQSLSLPVYLSEIKTEADADTMGIAPVIYVWNENRETGSFSVSVNGKAVAHLLESFVPREHKLFCAIRDEVVCALSAASQGSIVSTCEKLGAFPSDLFSR